MGEKEVRSQSRIYLKTLMLYTPLFVTFSTVSFPPSTSLNFALFYTFPKMSLPLRDMQQEKEASSMNSAMTVLALMWLNLHSFPMYFKLMKHSIYSGVCGLGVFFLFSFFFHAVHNAFLIWKLAWCLCLSLSCWIRALRIINRRNVAASHLVRG